MSFSYQGPHTCLSECCVSNSFLILTDLMWTPQCSQLLFPACETPLSAAVRDGCISCFMASTWSLQDPCRSSLTNLSLLVLSSSMLHHLFQWFFSFLIFPVSRTKSYWEKQKNKTNDWLVLFGLWQKLEEVGIYIILPLHNLYFYINTFFHL